MKIAITGSSGLVGSALVSTLVNVGHQVVCLRRPVDWDPDKGVMDPAILAGASAVVHLAGESVNGLRWTDEKKKAIRDSRVLGTRNVVDAISKLQHRPKVFVSSSAIGFYGERGDEEVTESSAAGDTFLADVSKQWEGEARRAEDAGIRTVLLRTGIVLSKEGGALGTMLLPFKMGVGGVIGSGKQWMSWISMDDHVNAVNFVIENDNIRGAVNSVSPHPVTNEDFTKRMGEVLYRPTFIPLPEFAVSMLMGEMGDELLLTSTKVIPKRLDDAGFEFTYPDLKTALEHALE